MKLAALALTLLAAGYTGATGWAAAKATVAAYEQWVMSQCTGNPTEGRLQIGNTTIFCAQKETQP